MANIYREADDQGACAGFQGANWVQNVQSPTGWTQYTIVRIGEFLKQPEFPVTKEPSLLIPRGVRRGF
jgi:hypothetical protein